MTLHVNLADEALLKASLDEALRRAPFPVAHADVWLFVYGALAADPPFRPAEQRVATLPGYSRCFNIADPLNRGTAEAPGLVLGLERSGACDGLAYRIEPGCLETDLMTVWRQEMRLPAYVPVWAEAHAGGGPIPVLVFDTRRDGPLYRPGLADAAIAEWIAGSAGEAGANVDYWRDTVEAFRRDGIQDRHLTAVGALM
jgi:cation transport protein ChaC